MGCQSSKLQELGEITISIVDPSFMRPENAHVRDKLSQNNIRHQYYISINCFIQEFNRRYINEVVADIENYQEIYEKLSILKFKPNIYVIGGTGPIEENLPDNISFLSGYSQLIEKLKMKSMRIKEIEQKEFRVKQPKEKRIDVKILKKPGKEQSSQQLIFHSTLKSKQLSHQMYESFQQLEQSMYEKDSHFVVTDYVYHKEVLALVANQKTKVICFCKLSREEVYDPEIYFISNNFLEIATEIANQISVKHLHKVKCSKIYFYTVNVPNAKEYILTIQAFNFDVKPFSDLDKMLMETSHFFCVTILAADSEVKNVQKYLQRNQYGFKCKVISFLKETDPSGIGMRKIIKDFKKGYRAEKGITNSIDIIDKHYDNIKFQQIKTELEKNDINCYGYSNLNQFIKTKKFISPFIICNYQEKVVLIRYLKQVSSSAKIVIFCNKTKINTELKENQNFAFVSSHFGKIISFIKKKKVYRPIIQGEYELQINEKVEKLKNRNKRISALKWCGLDGKESDTTLSDKEAEKLFQFVNIAENANSNSIRDLQKDAAMLWKLDYKPIENFTNFKNDLSDSLQNLRKIYRINYPKSQFSTLLSDIKTMEISKLLSKVRQFFQSQNEFGLKINQSLAQIQSMSKEEIICLREFLFLANLNFASMYRTPRLGKIVLQHWSSQALLEKCQIGSYLLNKNYFVFYQQNQVGTETLSSYNIVTEISYDTLTESDLNVNSFFKYRNKFIFSPYSQFRVKKIQKALGHQTVVLEYIKNVEFLKYYYSENLMNDGSGFIELFDQAITNTQEGQTNLVTSLVDHKNLDAVKLSHQRLSALKFYKDQRYEEAIHLHKSTIKEEEEQDNLDSAKINELNYELAFFLLKNGSHTEAANLIKDILEANPSEYIRQQCETTISSVVNNGTFQAKEKADLQGSQLSEPSYESESSLLKTNQKLKKVVDKQAMKTFVWLQENQGDCEDLNDDDFNDSADETKTKKVMTELKNTDNEMNCLEIDDLEYNEEGSKKLIQKEQQLQDGKQNELQFRT